MTNQANKFILIFNPVSSAAYLGEKLREFGISSVALYTINLENEYIQVKEDVFDTIIFTKPDLIEIRKALSGFKFDFVLNGIDEGFAFFETICNELFPQFANDTTLANYRKDKFAIQEALKVSGLPYIKQIKFSRHNLSKLEINKIGYPCFIKPINGSASIGARVCQSYDDVIDSVNECVSSPIGTTVDEFIVQEVIDGTEIFVDVFSVNKEHYISSVQTIVKKTVNNAPCYRYQRIIRDKDIWKNATEFVKKTLSVCGFKNGFTHTELFYMTDGSFKLIEVNPRISGVHGLCNVLATLSGLPSQPDLLNAYLKHNKPLISATANQINSYAYLLYLYNFSNRVSKQINIDKSQFSTLKNIIFNPQDGKPPPKVKNLFNVDCKVLLQSANYDSVKSDMDKLFELELSGKLF